MTTSECDPISQWLAGLKAGDEQAAQAVWEQYRVQLVHIALQRLGGAPHRAEDAEDAALSAVKSFLLRARNRQFSQLEDRHDVWKLLMTITVRKAIKVLRKERGRHPSAAAPMPCNSSSVGFTDELGASIDSVGELLSREPAPEVATIFTEELRAILDRLHNAELRQIFLWRLDGYTNQEVADKLGWYIQKVERKFQLIRRLCLEE